MEIPLSNRLGRAKQGDPRRKVEGKDIFVLDGTISPLKRFSTPAHVLLFVWLLFEFHIIFIHIDPFISLMVIDRELEIFKFKL